jgi:hypothetical protein
MRAFSKVILLSVCLSLVATVPIQRGNAARLEFSLSFGTGKKPDYYKLPSEIELSSDELIKMKKALRRAVNRYNYEMHEYKSWQIILGEYGVQYKMSISKKDEKIVWINGFCKDSGFNFKNLNSEVINVLDGGNCFFNTTIDIKSGEVAPIVIHGSA